jgi:hypothetical protein
MRCIPAGAKQPLFLGGYGEEQDRAFRRRRELCIRHCNLQKAGRSGRIVDRAIEDLIAVGAVVVDDGTNAPATAVFFGISVLFWVLTTVVLIRCVRASLPSLTPEAAVLLSRATVLLLAGWAIYPLVVSIQLFAAGGAWTTTIQVALCVTDVVVKVGFGALIHRIGMLRTAEDVRAGDDIHPEAIWISSVKQSDAGRPREVYLAQSSTVHPTRTRPPDEAAVPIDPEPETPEARLVEAATEL